MNPIEFRREEMELFALRASLAGLRDETVPPEVYKAIRRNVLARADAMEGRAWWKLVPVLATAVTCVALVLFAVHAKRSAEPLPPLPRLPELPGVAAMVPAPPRRPVLLTKLRAKPQAQPMSKITTSAEPLVVKLITNDPDVVIYWIADPKKHEVKR